MNKCWSRKEMLNKAGFYTTAAISYTLDVEDGMFDGILLAGGSMTISDCTRTITLQLDIEEDDDFENTMHKLDTLISVLEQAKKDAPKARKRYLKEKLKKDKKKKKKA